MGKWKTVVASTLADNRSFGHEDVNRFLKVHIPSNAPDLLPTLPFVKPQSRYR